MSRKITEKYPKRKRQQLALKVFSLNSNSTLEKGLLIKAKIVESSVLARRGSSMILKYSTRLFISIEI